MNNMGVIRKLSKTKEKYIDEGVFPKFAHAARLVEVYPWAWPEVSTDILDKGDSEDVLRKCALAFAKRIRSTPFSFAQVKEKIK